MVETAQARPWGKFALVTVPGIVLLGSASGWLSNSGYGNAWFDALESVPELSARRDLLKRIRGVHGVLSCSPATGMSHRHRSPPARSRHWPHSLWKTQACDFFLVSRSHDDFEEHLQESGWEITQIVFFLLFAMALVELISRLEGSGPQDVAALASHEDQIPRGACPEGRAAPGQGSGV